MAYLLKLGAKYINFINEYGDPRVENWFLVNAVTPPAISLLIYYYVLFSVVANYMKNKEPFDLRKTLIWYNGLQMLACSYIVYECLNVIKFDFVRDCHNVDFTEKGLRELRICYLYFMIKVCDLADTIFFVLRKKQNQITFLHLYHHGGMVLMTWGITKFYGGGSIIFIPFINSIVHVFMYGYYLLSVKMKEKDVLIKMKRNITEMQLVQFFILMVIIVRIALSDNCNIPPWAAWAFIVQNIFMISLFLDFYLKTYIYKKKDGSQTTVYSKEIESELLKSVGNFNLRNKHEKRI